MRLPMMLATATLLTGCSIPFDFSTNGTINFTLGDLGPDCSQDENPTTYPTDDGGSCDVTYEVSGDTCIITANCYDFQLISTDEVADEIAESTNNNDNVRTRITRVDITFSNPQVGNGSAPQFDVFDIGIRTDKEGSSQLEVVNFGAAEYETLVAAGEVEVYSGPETDRDYDETEYPFIAQLNECIENGSPLPVLADLRIELPLSEVPAIQGEGVTGSLDFDAEVGGRGSLRLIGGGGN